MDSKTRLKNLRSRYGLSLRKLSQYISVGYSNLSRLETSNAGMNMKTLTSLTNFYQVTSDYILGNESAGFIIMYDDGQKTFANLITESELDSYIEKKELEEAVGSNHVERFILSSKLADEIKKKYYYDPKTKVLHTVNEEGEDSTIAERKKKFIDEAFYYYDGMSEDQKVLIIAMMKSLSGKK